MFNVFLRFMHVVQSYISFSLMNYEFIDPFCCWWTFGLFPVFSLRQTVLLWTFVGSTCTASPGHVAGVGPTHRVYASSVWPNTKLSSKVASPIYTSTENSVCFTSSQQWYCWTLKFLLIWGQYSDISCDSDLQFPD